MIEKLMNLLPVNEGMGDLVTTFVVNDIQFTGPSEASIDHIKPSDTRLIFSMVDD